MYSNQVRNSVPFCTRFFLGGVGEEKNWGLVLQRTPNAVESREDPCFLQSLDLCWTDFTCHPSSIRVVRLVLKLVFVTVEHPNSYFAL